MRIIMAIGMILFMSSHIAQAELYRCDTGRGTYVYTNIACMNENKKETAPTQQQKANLFDPDMLQQQHRLAMTAKQQQVTTKTRTSEAIQPVVKPVNAVAAKAEIATASLPEEMQVSSNSAPVTMASYQPGMSWLLQLKGSFSGFERYEITQVDQQRVHGKRFLFNANKEPLDGGEGEDFVIDLHDQPEFQGPLLPIRVAGMVFECRQQKNTQAEVWHMKQLPLVTPLVRYPSGDESRLVEFTQ